MEMDPDVSLNRNLNGKDDAVREQEGNWQCECGNWNYRARDECNMRKCRKRNPNLGPEVKGGWNCPACGNVNFAEREECNMRSCKMPRPEYNNANRRGAPRQSGPIRQSGRRSKGAPYETYIRPGPRRFGGPAPVRNRDEYIGKEDAGGTKLGYSFVMNDVWICVCGNENYSNRDVCNMRKCGLPKPPPRSKNPTSAGMWICDECGNENYAERDFCNMRKCGLPRPGRQRSETSDRRRETETYVAQPRSNKDSDSFDRPERWVCPACGNFNYGERMNCNMRKCGLPRPEPEPVERIPTDGDWTCECGNLNYRGRETCNMRKCGLPRPN